MLKCTAVPVRGLLSSEDCRGLLSSEDCDREFSVSLYRTTTSTCRILLCTTINCTHRDIQNPANPAGCRRMLRSPDRSRHNSVGVELLRRICGSFRHLHRYRVVPKYYTLWKRKIDLFIPPFGHPLETENKP